MVRCPSPVYRRFPTVPADISVADQICPEVTSVSRSLERLPSSVLMSCWRVCRAQGRRSKKGAEAPSESEKSSLGHAHHLVAGDNAVINQADPDEIQRVAQAPGYELVGVRRLGDARGVRVHAH